MISREGGLNESISAYEKAVELAPSDGINWFRLGALLQRRSESDHRQEDDAQRARGAWGKALEINPNQYIWRRRLQQYGATRDKPYSLYGWVAEAQEAIRKRGEEPYPLRVALTRSESATLQEQVAVLRSPPKNPDPQDRIFRDEKPLVRSETIVTPQRIAPGETVHVEIRLRLDRAHKSHWNNEVEPLRLWVHLRSGWVVNPQMVVQDDPEEPTSIEGPLTRIRTDCARNRQRR